MNEKNPIRKKEEEKLADFRDRVKPLKTVDAYAAQLEELFLIRNPRFKFQPDYGEELKPFVAEHLNGKSMDDAGNWFYFPWNGILAHFLPEDMHQEIRTARNRNIITAEEQKKFRDFRVGIMGLSVGSHAALTISMMGGANSMKIADPDEISGSNLNRIRYDFTRVDEKKCDVAAQAIWQMNPYCDLSVYPEGVNTDNLHGFLAEPQKLGVLVEEMDHLEMKIRARFAAKELGIPVIMATDNGDNVIVDVERYDTDPDMEIFNGTAGHLTIEEFMKFPPQELPRLATKIAGPEHVVPRMQKSLLEVGRTIYSWPQLGDAATLAGVSVAYLVKRLALGEDVKSGKYEVNLDAIFDPSYRTAEAEKERKEVREDFLKKIGL